MDFSFLYNTFVGLDTVRCDVCHNPTCIFALLCNIHGPSRVVTMTRTCYYVTARTVQQQAIVVYMPYFVCVAESKVYEMQRPSRNQALAATAVRCGKKVAYSFEL